MFTKLKERYRESLIILRELVKTDFLLRYQGSFLGIAWSVLKPLMLFCVMYVVFVKFLRFSDGTDTFPLVLLLGISMWNFFTESTTMGLCSITTRGDLLRKINFPKYIIVVSATINALICMSINLGVVIVACILSGVQFTVNVFWLPINLVQLYLLSLGVALLLSTLNVYFRDAQHIWEVVLQGLFYATPIIYPLSMVEQKLGEVAPGVGLLIEKLMLLNPAAQIIQDIRHNLIAPATTPTIWTLSDNIFFQMIPIALTFAMLLWGVHVFRKYSPKFAEVM
ncbi:ABC transporter permease [Collinsella intestinalis]|uniref:Transport permease protein n=1 Tax=Collinsella intestinalis TaxID=147207 RepID=A0A414NG17_9ACTN|nr:ABC transporter permease [Collinsella intestinalis]